MSSREEKPRKDSQGTSDDTREKKEKKERKENAEDSKLDVDHVNQEAESEDNNNNNDGDASPTATTTVKVVIDSTKDLWQNITNNVKESNLEVTETNLLMVGSSGSGKTTLLQRIYATFQSASAASGGGGGGKGEDGDDDGGDNTNNNKGKKKKGNKIKPTTALDYSFARRTDRNVSQVAHFWELAQGTDLSMLSDIIINPENIHALVFAVVVDVSSEYNPLNNTNQLSGPRPVSNVVSAWDVAVFWLRRMDERVEEIFHKMKAKHSKTPEKLMARAVKIVGGADHPDLDPAVLSGGGGGGKHARNKMRLCGLPTILVVNKMDLFAENTARLKLMVNSFRFLAHLYGAHIIFTSENNTNAWKHLISHILFQSPFDPKYIEADCERGNVLLTADKDTFATIGEPDYIGGGRGGSDNTYTSSGDSELERWRGPLVSAFPPPENAEELLKSSAGAAAKGSGKDKEAFVKRLYTVGGDGYGEPTIDALRKQKDEELEQYRKANKTKAKK